MNRFPIKSDLKIRPNLSNRRYTVGSVSHVALVDGTLETMMNTPNEKFKAGIKALCGVLGITELEFKSYPYRGSYTTYYRVRGINPEAAYYTAADFMVVLSSMLTNRLADGEKLTK